MLHQRHSRETRRAESEQADVGGQRAHLSLSLTRSLPRPDLWTPVLHRGNWLQRAPLWSSARLLLPHKQFWAGDRMDPSGKAAREDQRGSL